MKRYLDALLLPGIGTTFHVRVDQLAFSSTFLAFLPGRVLPFDFLKILPFLVRASPLPMVVPPVVIV